MTRTAGALAAGLALLAIALIVTLSGSPVVVTLANSTRNAVKLAETYTPSGACQAGEVLPAGTSAIRFSLTSDAGPRVSVRVLSGTRVLTGGVAETGWTSGAVTVPVGPLARSASGVRVCFELGSTNERVTIGGDSTSPALAAIGDEGRALPGRMRIEYLRSGPSSWWSMAHAVSTRMGLGRAPAGTWIVFPLLAAMVVVVAGASWLVLKELR
jgi:hypothetical protein